MVKCSMNPLKLTLDEKTYKRLYSLCGGDEKAMQEFAARAIADRLAKNSDEKNSQKPGNPDMPDNPDLEDYLKSGKPGSRSYGIKGQGW